MAPALILARHAMHEPNGTGKRDPEVAPEVADDGSQGPARQVERTPGQADRRRRRLA